MDITKTVNRINYGGIIRAERKGRLGLILSKMEKPITRFDGKRVSYRLEDMVLSQDNDNELACVESNDFTFHSAKELAPFLKQKKELFSFLTVS